MFFVFISYNSMRVNIYLISSLADPAYFNILCNCITGLMKSAIAQIRAKPENNFRKHRLSLQRMAMREREYRERAEVAKGDHRVFRKLSMICYKCPQEICTTEELRLFKYHSNEHIICVSDQFETLCQVKAHKKPKVFDHLLKKSKIACKGCNKDWGVIMVYKRQINFPMLKPQGFRFVDENCRSITGGQSSSWPEIDYIKITERELCDIFKNKYH